MRPPPTEFDAEILRRVASGDASAFGRLYDAHGRLVYSLACRIVGDTSDAEDVVQDVFAQAWRQAAQFDASRGSVAAWLLTIARTRALDRLRARKTRPTSGRCADIVENEPIDTGPTPERHAVTQDEVARMRQAMDALDTPQRTALELAYFRGLTHSEMADALGEPLGTVKTRVRTALARLRAALRPDR